MPQKFLSIKNFAKYQSYTKKNPPWFKIHRSLFGDRAFMKLSTHHRYLYVGLIHLAVESDNHIYNDSTWIGQRLYIPHTEVDLKPLYRAGFLLTSNLHRTLSETETDSSETELTETDSTERARKPRAKPQPSRSRRAKLEGFTITDSDRAWAKDNLGIPNADEYIDEFKDYWRGIDEHKLKADWQATFRNRLRFLKEHNQLKVSVWT